jgi:glutaconate CoA-transferase, subunit B
MVTTLGVFDFEPGSRRMRLLALHPGVSVADVHANTGFEVVVSDALITTTPPTDEELEILHMLDPGRQSIG